MFSTRLAVMSLCLLSSIGYSQANNNLKGADNKQPAIVTVYMSGKPHMGFKTFIDGVLVGKFAANRQVSFRVVPGYHELKVEGMGMTPTRAMRLDPGQQVYFDADWEHTTFAAFSGLSNFHLTLSPVNSVLDLTTKEDKPSQEHLDAILATANPTGVDPASVEQPQITSRTLTDAEVSEAIFQGLHDSNATSIGYTLIDTQTNLLSGMVVNGGVSGYSITVFTSAAWIERQAAEAHRMMKSFGPQDVDPTMRQDLILVVAAPSTPGRLDARGIAAGSSASHVVLSDESKKTVIQPLHEETAGVSV